VLDKNLIKKAGGVDDESINNYCKVGFELNFIPLGGADKKQ